MSARRYSRRGTNTAESRRGLKRRSGGGGCSSLGGGGRLCKLVERLPRDQSRVIAMRFAEQKSIREIAPALGRSEGSIKQLQFRAMQNLRVRLGDSNG